MADDAATPDSDPSDGLGSPAAESQGTQQLRLVLDDSAVDPVYANLCLATSTADEVILDFAMNAAPAGQQTRKLRILRRVVITHKTAKQLTQLLATIVQRHETTIGSPKPETH